MNAIQKEILKIEGPKRRREAKGEAMKKEAKEAREAIRREAQNEAFLNFRNARRLQESKLAIEAQANEAKERAEFYSSEWKEALKKGKAEALAPNGFFQSHFNFWNARSLALFGALGLLEALGGMEEEAWEKLLSSYMGLPEKQSQA